MTDMRNWTATFVFLWLSAGLCMAEANDAHLAKDGPTAATQPATSQPDKKTEADKSLDITVERVSTTGHQITLDGKVLKYRATAANMPMKDESGKVKATVFFVAYEKVEGADVDPASTQPTGTDPAARPVTFVFNGGPGAAAVWLHLGTAGPRRIALLDDGEAPGPPYRLIENSSTWLDVTDLVFIDPVGTGFSRPAEGEKREQFYGVVEDIEWVADFIRLYVSKYGRWLSPVFLAGESYGTTRAAGLSEHLLDRYGIALNGIVFISSVLDFQTIRADAGNDLPYPLYLPTYAAIAWHHRRLAKPLQDDLQKTLKEVEQWAANEYTVALAKGGSLEARERQAVVKKLERYTAMPADFIEKCNLRIRPSAFQKHLLASEQKLVGRFDARITGFDPEPTSNWPTYDPSLSRYFAIYSSVFNDYVRRVLKYDSVLPYEVLSDKVRPWKFGEDGTGYLSVADNLRSAMIKNPHLKVMFAGGYFDLATPYFGTRYTVDHLGLPPDLRANISNAWYMGGHMMYHHKPSLEKLKADVAAFIRSALPTGVGR